MAKQYHIEMERGEVGRYVLLPGDPGRRERIASFFERPVKVAQHREYVTYTGYLGDIKVSVTSTGIGGPSTAIAVEELIQIGADTFIRVGTCGGIQPGLRVNDLAIATGAVRDEGTTMQYVPPAFPAVSDLQVTSALLRAAKALKVRHHLGLFHSKDSFYGEIQPQTMPIESRLAENWRAWVRAGVMVSEMEASTLFVVAAVRRVRAGAIVQIVNAAPENPGDGVETLEPLEDMTKMIATAVEAVRLLAAEDADAN